jgi:hypothetical protein
MAQTLSPSRTQQATPTVPNAPMPEPDRRDRIARAAYHRWQARGGGDGNDLQDWFEAESEVDQEKKS